ncbi:sulfotransferase family protein [Nonomuraea candida]|uniref:sulfotransferase family protein n=1 Tax=Nonomuraea candida TaxID=359159 RepID=UPI0005B9A7C8|nr:sulfotransferase family protein [Nonomuraea candida]
MLTVIGAGFPRTGTSSMKAALERLGFGPCHHMYDVMSGPARIDRWLPLAGDGPVDWDHVLEGFRSSVDWPASHFWREQALAYPEAKVVLTVREPHAWYRSMMTLIETGPRALSPEGPPPPAGTFLAEVGRLTPLLDRMAAALFGPGRTMADGPVDEASAVAAFERHTATVRASLPPERLLVFDVREGWEPLCRFLEVDVPREPFPHLNDAKSLQDFMARMLRGDTSNPSFLTQA